MLCLLVDRGEGDQVLYSSIRGFDFRWGVEVEARLRERRVLNPPEDGSSIRYTLVQTRSEAVLPAGTEFVWSLSNVEIHPEWGFVWVDVESGMLLDGTGFVCANAHACADVQTANEQGLGITVTFAFDGDGGIELVDAELEP